MSTDKGIRFFVGLLSTLAVVSLLSVGQAQEQDTTVVVQKPKPAAIGWPGRGKRVAYPAEGKITTENVLVRAGGNLNYYICGRLSE
jgi:hypothetical protein